jgi:hypothetical protein
VAISDDGVHYEKYARNPVLTSLLNDGPEEGPAAGTARLDREGRVVLFFGANSEAGSPLFVNADVRVSVSSDGLRFEDGGMVLDYSSPDVWVSGYELFPLIAPAEGSRWIVYYVPNGHSERGVLGVAWGDAPEQLPHTTRVLGPWWSRVRTWGMGSAGRMGSGAWALFLNQVHDGDHLEVRLVDSRDFRRVGAVCRSYKFESALHGTVLLDRNRETGFLYERRFGHYGVRIAPLVRFGASGERRRLRCPDSESAATAEGASWWGAAAASGQPPAPAEP